MKMIYKQVGVTALRSPTGEFLPAVPLYAEVWSCGDGHTPAEHREAREVMRLAVRETVESKKRTRRGAAV